jgi:5,10-methylenetetrahydromethanopterin reductase
MARYKVGCYLLPGKTADPRTVVSEALAAQDCGMDALWLAEKYDVKDLPVLLGAVSQQAPDLQLGAAVTHLGVRHPVVTASMGQTLQLLTNGRFRLGFGRSMASKWRDYGINPPTLEMFADVAQILRRLWAGKTVSYTGPAGHFPNIVLESLADIPAPALLMAAVGPKTLEMAGALFDGVILHPLLTPDGVYDSATRARNACANHGGNPDTFLVIATVLVSCGGTKQQQRRDVADRGSRYFAVPGLGEALCRVNGWDASALSAIREHSGQGSAAKYFPQEWIDQSAAIGGADECSSRLSVYSALSSELILHGMTAPELADLMTVMTAKGTSA